MNILHLINAYSPVFGCGPADRCQKMAITLSSRGHQVSIFTSNHSWDPEYADAGSSHNMEVIPFPYRAGRFCYTPAMASVINRRIHEFDILHLMNHWTHQNILGYRAARTAGKPYLFSAMGALPIVYRSFLIKRIYNALYGYRIICDAAALIGITRTECRQYETLGMPASRIHFLPNAIDEKEYFSPVEPGLFRRKFNIPADKKLILFLGRLSHIKGPDLLLEGFIRNRDQLQDVVLAFVGPDYDMEASLRQTVTNAGVGNLVFFCGPLTGLTKRQAYRDADVFVVPSRQENMSIVAVEACAMGTPVVITDACDFEDIQTQGAGKVVPVDSEAIIHAANEIIQTPQLRHTMSSQAIAMVQNSYTWQQLGKQLETILQDVVQNHD